MASQNQKSETISGYEHSDAFDEGYLAVSDLHKLHYEQYGNPQGKPGMTFLSAKPRFLPRRPSSPRQEFPVVAL